ncbi:hypothetical protein Gpo141_00006313 [Globisporangium polare]
MAMDFPAAMPATDAETTTSSNYGAAALASRRESVSIGGEQATAELARSLPELIEQLRLLHVQMEKSAKVYDAISSGQLKTHQEVANGSMSNSSSQRQQQSQSSMIGAGRQSIFTPFADSADFDRASILSPPDAYADVPINRHSAPLELGELSGGAQLMSRQASQQMLQQQQQRQNWPAQPISAARKPAVMRSVDYTVMWVSGECGISLRNFSTNKIGAQIAVLQQAEGVTTGIANCRLGDQLISVNDDRVEVSTFKDIVQKLKTTRRPITLGFRTNPNVATSPVAASSSGLSRSVSSSARFSNGRKAAVNNRAFFPADEEPRSSAPGGYAPAPVHNSTNSGRGSSGGGKTTEEAAAARFSDERPTDASVRSSTSTLSDEVEVWCKEQEEMHSDIIVLLTETVMRCEKLQQENMDQLQNWMQVAPSMYSATTSAASATLSKKDSTFALLSNTGSDSEE